MAGNDPGPNFTAECVVFKDQEEQPKVTRFINAHLDSFPVSPGHGLSLEDENRRRIAIQAHYTEEELDRHMLEMENQLLPQPEHLNLHPPLIYFTPNNKLMICSRSRNALEPTAIAAYWEYKSPKMRGLRDGKCIEDIKQDRHKSDVYSLGMIFIQMASLDPSVDGRRDLFRGAGRYSQKFLWLLQWMTEEDERNRPNLVTLHNFLAPKIACYFAQFPAANDLEKLFGTCRVIARKALNAYLHEDKRRALLILNRAVESIKGRCDSEIRPEVLEIIEKLEQAIVATKQK